MTDDRELGDILAERVRLLQLRFAEQVEGLSNEELKASGKTLDWPRQQAIRVVAEERGITYDSVRKRILAWKQKEERLKGQASRYAEKMRSYFECYGLSLEQGWVESVIELEDMMHEAEFYLRRCQNIMKHTSESEWYPGAALRQARELSKQLKSALENALPVGICPYCKTVPEVMEECVPCYGKGLLLDGAMKDVPPKYFGTTLPIVLYRGGDRLLSEFAEEMVQKEMF